ncbi:hypothetical protein [Chryseobacterium salviniae]|uniref:Uncharacterized protein n=1 Tax=Chryseobacterium salviniae TaxID=3101750 RepID=A0ABU6HVG8_9FLAO|nr:hypothetical protein [Chryseobacterium sp. T9W2-O]MEC3876858.1 hypothetical protein [Chryseobacterium sp. T9W2-O]
MLHEERILKNKFAYFFAIVFVLCWMIFFAYNMFNIFVRNYGLKDEYSGIKIPIYALYFLILPLLSITLVSIFKESIKMFTYLNISLLLMIIFHGLLFYISYTKVKKPNEYLISYMFSNLLFIVGPTILINYLKYSPANNEIESIGTHND